MKKYLILSLSLLFLSVSCDKKSEDQTPTNQPTSNTTGNGAGQIYIDGVNSDLVFTHAILWNQTFGGLDYTELQVYFGDGNGKEILIDIRNYLPQNPPENAVISKIYDTDGIGDNTVCSLGPDELTYCDIAGGGYSINETLLFDSFYHDSSEPGMIEITSCDGGELKVSGTFEFEVTEYMDAAENVTISGSFTNVPYVVF